MSARYELQAIVHHPLTNEQVVEAKAIFEKHWCEPEYENLSDYTDEKSFAHLLSGEVSLSGDPTERMDLIAMDLVPIIGKSKIHYTVYYLDEIPNDSYEYSDGQEEWDEKDFEEESE